MLADQTKSYTPSPNPVNVLELMDVKKIMITDMNEAMNSQTDGGKRPSNMKHDWKTRG